MVDSIFRLKVDMRKWPKLKVDLTQIFFTILKKGYIFLPANEIDLLFFLTVKTNAGDVVSSIKLDFIEY